MLNVTDREKERASETEMERDEDRGVGWRRIERQWTQMSSESKIGRQESMRITLPV